MRSLTAFLLAVSLCSATGLRAQDVKLPSGQVLVGTVSTTYDYDEAGRMARASVDDHTEFAYTYGEGGSRTSSVTTVNAAPSEFDRLLPIDSELVDADTLYFAWSASTDPEGAAVIYTLSIESSVVQEVLTTADTSASIVVDRSTLQVPSVEVGWTVTGSDGARVVEASNGAGRFSLARRSSVSIEKSGLPERFALYANYPNPFNPETNIAYDLAAPATVRLVVFDVIGRQVRLLTHEAKEPGRHVVRWDGRDEAGRIVATGVYLYRIDAGAFSDTRTMLFMK